MTQEFRFALAEWTPSNGLVLLFTHTYITSQIRGIATALCTLWSGGGPARKGAPKIWEKYQVWKGMWHLLTLLLKPCIVGFGNKTLVTITRHEAMGIIRCFSNFSWTHSRPYWHSWFSIQFKHFYCI